MDSLMLDRTASILAAPLAAMLLAGGPATASVERNECATSARIVPNLINGKVEGYKIFAIPPQDLMERVGLRNGDVIFTVNDMKVKDIETENVRDFLTIWFCDLQVGQHVEYEVRRHARYRYDGSVDTMTIAFDVDDVQTGCPWPGGVPCLRLQEGFPCMSRARWSHQPEEHHFRCDDENFVGWQLTSRPSGDLTEAVGLEIGDIVTSIGGNVQVARHRSTEWFCEPVSGQHVEIEYLRDGQKHTLTYDVPETGR